MTRAKSTPQSHGSSLSLNQKSPACSPILQHLAGWCAARVAAMGTGGAGAGNIGVLPPETSTWQEFPAIKDHFFTATEF